MTIKDICKARNVPAKRGGRVRYFGSGLVRMGTIKSAHSGYLRILLDGDKHTGHFHPTWMLEYLDSNGNTLLDTRK